jgi:hypothetical protein
MFCSTESPPAASVKPTGDHANAINTPIKRILVRSYLDKRKNWTALVGINVTWMLVLVTCGAGDWTVTQFPAVRFVQVCRL